jgi:Putative DNA-binding domain
MPTETELRSLLEAPAESLSIEHKSWLDLSNNADRAKLAKAAIAIANEGGGIIVIGMREDTQAGSELRSTARPQGVSRYSQDDVNASVRRFVDPEFHCGLMFLSHPASGFEHAFVIVPGGMTVPVMSKRGCEGVINAQRCYMRKPGPRSEEPFTAEEWRSVMQRCLTSGRESMLDAIRTIVQGHNAIAPDARRVDGLVAYSDASRERWAELVDPLPATDVARMPLGRYEIAFQLNGIQAPAGVGELRDKLQEAGRRRLTGWGPFVWLTREDLAPQAVQGGIEAWLGKDVPRNSHDAAHCDFWRAHPSGLLYQLRGYDEDSTDRVQPGTVFDVTLPIWRVSEAMLYAARLARLLGSDDADILVRCTYSGLKGRRLDCLTPGRSFSFPRIAADHSVKLQTTATAHLIDDNLVEILHGMLMPLYERFAFFELSLDLVRIEVERLRQGRF